MMKTITKRTVLAVLSLLVANAAFAQDLNCINKDKAVAVAITSDGGEETMTVSKAQSSEKYLVLYHDANKVVAMNDSAINGPSTRGAILSLNTYGKNYLSYDGELSILDCR